MPTCTQCGRINPDGVQYCQKCGIALGGQQRLVKDAKRAKVGVVTRTVTWICVLAFFALIARPVYHAVMKGYLTLQYNAETDRVTKECGGPVVAGMMSFQKAQIEECMAKSDSLKSAKKSMEAFQDDPAPKK